MKKIISTLLLSFSTMANSDLYLGDVFKPDSQKPTISNLQEGSIYKIKKDEYALVDSNLKVKNLFNLKEHENCDDILASVNKMEGLKNIKEINKNQVQATEIDQPIMHNFYCSDGVIVDIRMPSSF